MCHPETSEGLPGGMCVRNPLENPNAEEMLLGESNGPLTRIHLKRGEAFLLTVGVFLLTVKLLCLQSLKGSCWTRFPTVSKKAPTASKEAKAVSKKAKIVSKKAKIVNCK